MKHVKKAVIMAAGFGTRFLPFSKAVSKTMLPIIDIPTIELIVQEAVDSGIEEILIIVGINKEGIISHFSKNKTLENKLLNKPEYLKLVKQSSSYKIKFIEQKVLNGTGGAILLAESFTKKQPFLLMFADDLMVNKKNPVSKQIIAEYNKTGKTVLAVNSVPKEMVPKYSSVEYSKKIGRSMLVSRIVEKPKLEDVISTYSTLGRYVLTPEIYSYARKLKPTIGGEIFLTDAYQLMIKKEGVIAYDFEGTRYDIGNKFGYLTAVLDSALDLKEYREPLIDYIKKHHNI